MNICYSGGATGADNFFGKLALEHKHDLIHFTFSEYNINYELDHKNLVILSPIQLLKAKPFVSKANLVLQRTYPTNNEYVNKLLERNYYVIQNVDSVYAVTYTKNIRGTAWGLEMAKQAGCTQLYVFDMETAKWYSYNDLNTEITVPKPSGSYAGIGSRQLNEAGHEAILNLYQ